MTPTDVIVIFLLNWVIGLTLGLVFGYLYICFPKHHLTLALFEVGLISLFLLIGYGPVMLTISWDSAAFSAGALVAYAIFPSPIIID